MALAARVPHQLNGPRDGLKEYVPTRDYNHGIAHFNKSATSMQRFESQYV